MKLFSAFKYDGGKTQHYRIGDCAVIVSAGTSAIRIGRFSLAINKRDKWSVHITHYRGPLGTHRVWVLA